MRSSYLLRRMTSRIGRTCTPSAARARRALPRVTSTPTIPRIQTGYCTIQATRNPSNVYPPHVSEDDAHHLNHDEGSEESPDVDHALAAVPIAELGLDVRA